MLDNVNVLYLGMRVLILLDNTYIGRFWTSMESWMAMQQATAAGGLAPSPDDEARRFHIEPIHNASQNMVAALIEMWADKSAQAVHDVLARPDVQVRADSPCPLGPCAAALLGAVFRSRRWVPRLLSAVRTRARRVWVRR